MTRTGVRRSRDALATGCAAAVDGPAAFRHRRLGLSPHAAARGTQPRPRAHDPADAPVAVFRPGAHRRDPGCSHGVRSPSTRRSPPRSAAGGDAAGARAGDARPSGAHAARHHLAHGGGDMTTIDARLVRDTLDVPGDRGRRRRERGRALAPALAQSAGLRPGSRVAVTAGSRGIARIDAILRGGVRWPSGTPGSKPVPGRRDGLARRGHRRRDSARCSPISG